MPWTFCCTGRKKKKKSFKISGPILAQHPARIDVRPCSPMPVDDDDVDNTGIYSDVGFSTTSQGPPISPAARVVKPDHIPPEQLDRVFLHSFLNVNKAQQQEFHISQCDHISVLNSGSSPRDRFQCTDFFMEFVSDRIVCVNPSVARPSSQQWLCLVQLLQSHYGANYKLFKLSDDLLVDPRLCEHFVSVGWNERGDAMVPALESLQLCCELMCAWLQSTSYNVLIMVGLTTNAFLLQCLSHIMQRNASKSSRFFVDWMGIRTFCRRLESQAGSILSASHRRYLQYWQMGIPSPPPLPFPGPPTLWSMVLRTPVGYPLFSSFRYEIVDVGDQTILFRSALHQLKVTSQMKCQLIYLHLHPALRLKPNVAVIFWDNSNILFRVQFHSGFLSESSLSFASGDMDHRTDLVRTFDNLQLHFAYNKYFYEAHESQVNQGIIRLITSASADVSRHGTSPRRKSIAMDHYLMQRLAPPSGPIQYRLETCLTTEADEDEYSLHNTMQRNQFPEFDYISGPRDGNPYATVRKQSQTLFDEASPPSESVEESMPILTADKESLELEKLLKKLSTMYKTPSPTDPTSAVTSPLHSLNYPPVKVIPSKSHSPLNPAANSSADFPRQNSPPAAASTRPPTTATVAATVAPAAAVSSKVADQSELITSPANTMIGSMTVDRHYGRNASRLNEQAHTVQKTLFWRVLYLGSRPCEQLTGSCAVERTLDLMLMSAAATTTRLSFTQCTLHITTGHGLCLFDQKRRLFFRQYFPLELLSTCVLDPKNRRWSGDGEEETSNGLSGGGRYFGLVIRNGKGDANCCHICCEKRVNSSDADEISSVTNKLLTQPQLSSSSPLHHNSLSHSLQRSLQLFAH